MYVFHTLSVSRGPLRQDGTKQAQSKHARNRHAALMSLARTEVVSAQARRTSVCCTLLELIHARAHTHKHTHTRTHKHPHRLAHTHTYTYTHTHTFTGTLLLCAVHTLRWTRLSGPSTTGARKLADSWRPAVSLSAPWPSHTTLPPHTQHNHQYQQRQRQHHCQQQLQLELEEQAQQEPGIVTLCPLAHLNTSSSTLLPGDLPAPP